MSEPTGKRVALVMGVGAYDAPLRPLDNPVNDALGISEALRRLGFILIVPRGGDGAGSTGGAIADPDRDTADDAVSDFKKAARDADVALFYFAGHGVQVGGLNYLLLTDSEIRERDHLQKRTISVETLIADVSGRAKATIAILDACRDDPFSGTFMADEDEGTRAVTLARPGLATVNLNTGGTGGKPRTVHVVFATGAGQTTIDDAQALAPATQAAVGEHSPFTAALLSHIETPDMSFSDMIGEVSQTLQGWTHSEQQPWLYSAVAQRVFLAGRQSVAAPEKPIAVAVDPQKNDSGRAAPDIGGVPRDVPEKPLEQPPETGDPIKFGSRPPDKPTDPPIVDPLPPPKSRLPVYAGLALALLAVLVWLGVPFVQDWLKPPQVITAPGYPSTQAIILDIDKLNAGAPERDALREAAKAVLSEPGGGGEDGRRLARALAQFIGPESGPGLWGNAQIAGLDALTSVDTAVWQLPDWRPEKSLAKVNTAWVLNETDAQMRATLDELRGRLGLRTSRVSLQFPSALPGADADAKEVVASLRQIGWKMDDAEGTTNAPDQGQIRAGGSADRDVALDLQADMAAAGYDVGLNSRSVDGIRPGNLEVWLGATQSRGSWASVAPDFGWCLVRDAQGVGPQRFLVRCFENVAGCEAVREGVDASRKTTSCRFSSGLQQVPGDAALTGRGGAGGSWYRYSADPFPPPYPQFP